jgi:D-alanyl-D-alanine carboxypeptidase
MRTAFSRALFTLSLVAAFAGAVAPAEAAKTDPKQTQTRKTSLKPVSVKQGALAPQAAAKIPDRPPNCTKEQFSHSVRADLVFDLKTGTVISSNIPAEKHETTVIHPASLSKLESIKEIIQRIRAGLWNRFDKFTVKLPYPHKPVEMNLPEVVLSSANPSLNVIDSIADQNFMDGIAKNLKAIGATHSTYVSATGLPVSERVRKEQVTTLADIARSVRDFELNYATPEVSRDVLGLDRFTGIWKLSIAGIHRNTHTIKILEDAKGDGTKPYPGVTSGKSGYTCEFGFGSYVRYEGTGRPFIIFTSGHVLPVLRDNHTISLIESSKAAFSAFVEPPIRVIEAGRIAPLPGKGMMTVQALEPLR